MRFGPQTITITDNKDRLYRINALVAVQDDDTPVGLAVHPVYELGPGPLTPHPDEYTLTHLASGVRLHRDPVLTESIACRWLELIAPLSDWTQPHEALYRLHTLRLQVWVARVQARWDEEEDRDLFTTQIRTHPASLTFSLDALTALIEWVSYGMEYVQINPGRNLPWIPCWRSMPSLSDLALLVLPVLSRSMCHLSCKRGASFCWHPFPEKGAPRMKAPTIHNTPFPEVSPALETGSPTPLSTNWIPLHELITHWTDVDPLLVPAPVAPLLSAIGHALFALSRETRALRLYTAAWQKQQGHAPHAEISGRSHQAVRHLQEAAHHWSRAAFSLDSLLPTDLDPVAFARAGRLSRIARTQQARLWALIDEVGIDVEAWHAQQDKEQEVNA